MLLPTTIIPPSELHPQRTLDIYAQEKRMLNTKESILFFGWFVIQLFDFGIAFNKIKHTF